jgi:hypothetical protein
VSVIRPETSNTGKELLILIAHRSEDEAVAEAIADLLKSSLGLISRQIQRHAVAGNAGVNAQALFPEELKSAKVVVGVITADSLNSPALMFEMGARWGAGLPLALLLAGVSGGDLTGAVRLVDARNIVGEGSLQQFLEGISKQLGLGLQNPQSYAHHLDWVKQLACQIPNDTRTTIPEPVLSPSTMPQSRMFVSVERTPPEQVIEVKATTPIKVFRVEYMLQNEMCIVGENVALEGDAVSVALKHELIMKVWNTRRVDMNPQDRSGPAKIGVTISANGKLRQCVLPVQMEHGLIDSAVFPRLTGSKTFDGE